MGSTIFQDSMMAHAAEQLRRTEEAKRFVRDMDIQRRVAADFAFWTRRIKRAIKKGKKLTDNSWSTRGVETQSYIATLQTLLGDGYRVQFEHLHPSGEPDRIVRYIRVHWK